MSPRRSRRRACRPRFERLDDLCLLAVSGFSAAHLTQLYGFNASGAIGTGQTIAVVDAYHDPYLAGDLAIFSQANGLAGGTPAGVATFLSQVSQSGGPAGGPTNNGWAGETTLDVEAIHAVAPGARIVVVEARSENLDDMLAAVDTARSIPGVSVVSMSWGTAEFRGERAMDWHFTTPAGHTPITFLAATGDNGASGGAEWPSSSPNVVAVGGTTLFVDASGQFLGEQGWSGSGGGQSTIEPQPSYQRGVQSSGVRTTPDVSIVANPASGLMTYTTTPSDGRASWSLSGGTSLSTQLWAGLFADANQLRVASGRGTLDTSTALTILYNNPGAFNDVTSGFNGFRATPGYDLVTGIGTPRVAAVLGALATTGETATITTTAAVASTTSAPARQKAPRQRRHRTRKAEVTATIAVPTPDAVNTTTTTTTTDVAPPLPTTAVTANLPAIAAPSPSLPSTAVLQGFQAASTITVGASTPRGLSTSRDLALARRTAARPDNAPRPSPPTVGALKTGEADAPTATATAEPSPETDAGTSPAEPASSPPMPVPMPEQIPLADDGHAWLDRFDFDFDFDLSPETAPVLTPAQVAEAGADAFEEPSASTPLAVAAFPLVALWRRRPGTPIPSGRRDNSSRPTVPAGPFGRRRSGRD